MNGQRGVGRLCFVGLIVVFALAGPLINVLLSRVPSVTPAEVTESLAKAPGRHLLVDIRKDAVYPVPVSEGVVRACEPGKLDPAQLRAMDKVFVVCDTGWAGAASVRSLRRAGHDNVYNVQGGVEGWILKADGSCDTGACRRGAVQPPGSAGGVRRNVFTPFEQFVICFTSFGLKPIYEIVALLIAWGIWRRPESHWRSLRWGMVAFFLGENACAINYLLYGLENFTWEFWHCYGMLVAFGFTCYALLEFFDQQVVHASQKAIPCVFVRLCGVCYKSRPVACRLWVLSVFALPVAFTVCFAPLSASFRDFMCIGLIYGDEVVFSHSMLQQLYEVRVYPVLAMVLLAAAWVVLLVRRESGMESSRALVAAGLGILGFSLMRFLLFWAYSDNILWAEVWEEITEFMFIMAIVVLLGAKRISGWEDTLGLSPASPVLENGEWKVNEK